MFSSYSNGNDAAQSSGGNQDDDEDVQRFGMKIREAAGLYTNYVLKQK